MFFFHFVFFHQTLSLLCTWYVGVLMIHIHYLQAIFCQTRCKTKWDDFDAFVEVEQTIEVWLVLQLCQTNIGKKHGLPLESNGYLELKTSDIRQIYNHWNQIKSNHNKLIVYIIWIPHWYKVKYNSNSLTIPILQQSHEAKNNFNICSDQLRSLPSTPFVFIRSQSSRSVVFACKEK